MNQPQVSLGNSGEGNIEPLVATEEEEEEEEEVQQQNQEESESKDPPIVAEEKSSEKSVDGGGGEKEEYQMEIDHVSPATVFCVKLKQPNSNLLHKMSVPELCRNFRFCSFFDR